MELNCCSLARETVIAEESLLDGQGKSFCEVKYIPNDDAVGLEMTAENFRMLHKLS